MEKCKNKKCLPEKICNPESGFCVKKDGAFNCTPSYYIKLYNNK